MLKLRNQSHVRCAARQLGPFASTPRAVEELLALDVASLTPLEAINKLYEIQELAK